MKKTNLMLILACLAILVLADACINPMMSTTERMCSIIGSVVAFVVFILLYAACVKMHRQQDIRDYYYHLDDVNIQNNLYETQEGDTSGRVEKL